MKTQSSKTAVRAAGCLLTALVAAAAPVAQAQIIAPEFANNYSFVDLGSILSLPTPNGGLTFKFDDPNTLLIGGSANNSAGAIYSVGLLRDVNNHITGFSGPATFFSTATGGGGGGIDGGLTYGPNNTLFYTSYSDNKIGQIALGAAAPGKVVDLTPLGVASSVGSLYFVPSGFGGAGRLKILSYNGDTWYDASISPDGNGFYDVNGVGTPIQLAGGLEGVVYVSAVNPVFGLDSILVSEYVSGKISVYAVDANGDPIVASRRDFITSLSGAEGAAIDPVTGDFLFSTFGGGDRLIVVSGFTNVPEPSTLALVAFGFGGLLLWRNRRPARATQA